MSAPRTRKRKKAPARQPPQASAPVPAAAAPSGRPWDGLLARIPFLARRRGPQVHRRDVLAAVPFRNELIEWELREPDAARAGSVEVVVLRVPRRQDRWGRMLNRFFEGPGYRQVQLDEVGSDVWRLCDGATSVEAMILALARKHKLERREVEISLTMYLRTLARRGFIGLRMADSSRQE
jgi:hypothetical protein